MPGVGLLGHVGTLLTYWGTSRLFFGGFAILHSRQQCWRTPVLCPFYHNHPSGCEVVSHWFRRAFPWRLKMLSLFSWGVGHFKFWLCFQMKDGTTVTDCLVCPRDTLPPWLFSLALVSRCRGSQSCLSSLPILRPPAPLGPGDWGGEVWVSWWPLLPTVPLRQQTVQALTVSHLVGAPALLLVMWPGARAFTSLSLSSFTG